MTVEQIRDFFGSLREAAKQLGYHRNSLYYWQNNGGIPTARQLHVELLTQGKLKADRRPRSRSKGASVV